MSTGEQTPTMDDAFQFIMKVKVTFQHEEEKYENFIDVLKDFKAQRIGVPMVREIMKELFKGHRDLIVGFNFFLPKNYEITLPSEDEQPSLTETGSMNNSDEDRVTVHDAIAYVQKVKYTFRDEGEKIKHFLDIMNDFRTRRIDVVGVRKRMKVLFKGHDDLLLGLNIFLPKKYKIKLPLEEKQRPQEEPIEEPADDISFMGKMKAWIQGDNGGVCRSLLDTLDAYRREAAECLQGHVDLLREFSNLSMGSTEDEAYFYIAMN